VEPTHQAVRLRPLAGLPGSRRVADRTSWGCHGGPLLCLLQAVCPSRS